MIKCIRRFCSVSVSSCVVRQTFPFDEFNNNINKQDGKIKIERVIAMCKEAFKEWLEAVTKKTDYFTAAFRGE